MVDSKGRTLQDRIILRKDYEAGTPIAKKGPQGLARAMSLAWAGVAGQVIRDIAGAAGQAK